MQWDGFIPSGCYKEHNLLEYASVVTGLIAAGNMLMKEYSQLNGIEVPYRFALGTKRLLEPLIIENIKVLGDNYRHPPLQEE